MHTFDLCLSLSRHNPSPTFTNIFVFSLFQVVTIDKITFEFFFRMHTRACVRALFRFLSHIIAPLGGHGKVLGGFVIQMSYWIRDM